MPRITRWMMSPATSDLTPPDIMVRRLAVLLYAVGMISSQVAAHVGAFPVANLRLFELLGLVTFTATILTWYLTARQLSQAILILTSLTGILLIAAGIGLSGGSESPLWILYLFPVLFNAFFSQTKIVWAFLPIIAIASALPALIEGDDRQLMTQLILIAPIYVAVSLCSQTLVRGLQRASRLQVMATDSQARLEGAKQWSGQLQALHKVAQQITHLTSVNDIANAIIEHTRNAIPYDNARVYIRDEDTLLPIAFRGSREYAFKSAELLRLKVGDGLTGSAVQHATSLNVADAKQDPRAGSFPECAQLPESMLLSPLIDDGDVIGIVVLIKLGKGQFSSGDLQLLDILTDQATNAIAKTWKLEAAHQRARTDSLTGLLNHAAMYELMATQLDHATAQHIPLSIAVLSRLTKVLVQEDDTGSQEESHHGPVPAP